VTGTSTDGAALERPPVTADCNECNEALDATRAAMRAEWRLAVIAQNALLNGDVRRASTALRDLHDQQRAEAR
jgi:hypothetical protein